MVCWVILAAQRIIFFHVACRWNHSIDKHREKRFYMERYLIIAPLADFIFLRGKRTQNLECLISWAVSAEYAGLGVVSRKWRKQTYQESRTRPAGTVWWCLMGISHHEPAFYQILSFFPHKEVVMWKKNLVTKHWSGNGMGSTWSNLLFVSICIKAAQNIWHACPCHSSASVCRSWGAVALPLDSPLLDKVWILCGFCSVRGLS